MKVKRIIISEPFYCTFQLRYILSVIYEANCSSFPYIKRSQATVSGKVSLDGGLGVQSFLRGKENERASERAVRRTGGLAGGIGGTQVAEVRQCCRSLSPSLPSSALQLAPPPTTRHSLYPPLPAASHPL